MMDTKMTRTTITLPEDLLYEIKKKSLMERKSMKDIFHEGLRFFLDSSQHGRIGKKDAKPTLVSLFGTWGKGPRESASLRTLRHGKRDTERDRYLASLWRNS